MTKDSPGCLEDYINSVYEYGTCGKPEDNEDELLGNFFMEDEE